LKDNEFLITGTAEGVENGKKVFIETQTETGFIAKDTAVVENGKFELKGITEDVDLGFIRIEDENLNLPLILEEGKISVAIKTDTVQNSVIGGTDNNDKFQTFNEDSKVIARKKGKFEKANIARITAAKKANDTTTVNQIMKEYSTFQDDLNKVSMNFIKKNPDAYLSVLLLENFLMRQHLSVDEIKGYFAKIDKKLLNTKSAKNIKKVLEAMKNEPTAKVEVGSTAPDFAANNPEGKKISLRESMGKVTIIDFWASWCGPCRTQLPILEEFAKNNKDVQIVKINVDQNAELASEYGVKSIPTIIYFKNGVIAHKTVGIQQEKQLDEIKKEII
jgi:thioredoxin